MAHLKTVHRIERKDLDGMDLMWGVPHTPARKGAEETKRKRNDAQRLKRTRAIHKIRERQTRVWAGLEKTKAQPAEKIKRALAVRDRKLEDKLGLPSLTFCKYDRVVGKLMKLQAAGYHGLRLNYDLLFSNLSFVDINEEWAHFKGKGGVPALKKTRVGKEPTTTTKEAKAARRLQKRLETNSAAAITTTELPQLQPSTRAAAAAAALPGNDGRAARARARARKRQYSLI